MREKRTAGIVFALATLTSLIYLTWRTLFTIPFEDGALSVFFGLLLLGSEIVSSLGTCELYLHKARSHDIDLSIPVMPDEWYPDVDVLIATHNEEPELLYKTVNAAVHFDYPDKKKVHIYLSDDGNRPEVRRLAEHFGVGYLGLYNNKEAKSGNFNNALAHTSSPLVATFDADMIGRHTFLTETVPYFYLPFLQRTKDGGWAPRPRDQVDPDFRIGLVQTPQSFYNPDLFQFNLYAENYIPNEQDYFSREVNQMRNSGNAIAYTGSNTLISRQALEDIGGFPTDTITEDFETGLKIQAAGYTCYATDKVQAAGLSTTSIKSMITQRVRWARGVIQSVKNCHILTNPDLTLDAKVSYLACFAYWWSFLRRIIFTLAPILFALFDMRIVNCTLRDLMIFWLPNMVMYEIAQRFLLSKLRTQRWNQIIDTILAPFMVIPVFLETIGVKQMKFKVTEKSKTKGDSKLYILPHLTLLVMAAAGLIRFVYGKSGTQLIYGFLIIFWLLYDIVTLLYAVFFMMGRKAVRTSERFNAQETIRLQAYGCTIQTKTENLSEGGLAFRLDEPLNLPVNTPLRMQIETERVKVDFDAKILYVDSSGVYWRYHCAIVGMSEPAWREYLQAVYDREHSLPKRLNNWMSAVDDLLTQAERLRKHKRERHTAPYVNIGAPVEFEEGGSCVLERMYFSYARVVEDGVMHIVPCDAERCALRVSALDMPHADVVSLEIDDGISLKLMPQEPAKGKMLMKVLNYEELCHHPEFLPALRAWVRRLQKKADFMDESA